ncbi:MAG: hypothetical protein HYU02_06700 [Thaumarchaeota archaeon]|nr:hypothetical protein [Nitrososphaerota archaeon]
MQPKVILTVAFILVLAITVLIWSNNMPFYEIKQSEKSLGPPRIVNTPEPIPPKVSGEGADNRKS